MEQRGVAGFCEPRRGAWRCLSFFERKEAAEAAAKSEKDHWDAMYPQLGKTVRVERWGGHWALVMPHLSQSVVRDERALNAVEKTLTEDYADNRWMQPVQEVKWRNIGFYLSEGELKAVVFDVSHVERLVRPGSEWVRECVDALRNKL